MQSNFLGINMIFHTYYLLLLGYILPITHPLETYLMINYWTNCMRSR